MHIMDRTSIGVRCVSDALQANNVLERVALDHCDHRDPDNGYWSLIVALPVNSTLKHLGLSYALLGPNGLVNLAKVVAANEVLRSLNLSGNLVDERSATAWSITLGQLLAALSIDPGARANKKALVDGGDVGVILRLVDAAGVILAEGLAQNQGIHLRFLSKIKQLVSGGGFQLRRSHAAISACLIIGRALCVASTWWDVTAEDNVRWAVHPGGRQEPRHRLVIVQGWQYEEVKMTVYATVVNRMMDACEERTAELDESQASRAWRCICVHFNSSASGFDGGHVAFSAGCAGIQDPLPDVLRQVGFQARRTSMEGKRLTEANSEATHG
eukprot:Skav218572  [mRNA]  locus=scaffold2610:201543:216620:+ [translate_table: standard]